MADTPQLSEVAFFAKNLTTIEVVWLLGWNIVDGQWRRIGLDEAAGRDLLVDLFSKLHGGLDVVKQSGGRLQQRLMSLRQGTFEEIQQQAPFRNHSQRNMEALLRAWKEDGQAGFAQAWDRIFPAGRDAAREPQVAIRIIGEVGDCEERALEVIGAPNGETRVAAEWWYLYHTFGSNWTPGMHFTAVAADNSAHFSVHNITVLPDGQKRVYFRLPW